LKTQLLARSNKGVTPTAAGIALMNLARRVLHDMDDVYSQMLEYSSGTRGYVRVLSNISVITEFMPSQLKTFLTMHPHVQIDLEERTSSAIAKAVADNDADIGFFTLEPYGHDLEVFPYRKDELVLVVPKRHPLAMRASVPFADTIDYDYVGLHSGGSINLQLIKAATELGRTLRFRIQVRSFDALCLMVNAGLGIGILPSDSAKLYQRTLSLKTLRLKDSWAKRELAICVRSYKALSVAAKLLVDHFRVTD
jgi:DNA-binding transcriptional LysR family regulator